MKKSSPKKSLSKKISVKKGSVKKSPLKKSAPKKSLTKNFFQKKSSAKSFSPKKFPVKKDSKVQKVNFRKFRNPLDKLNAWQKVRLAAIIVIALLLVGGGFFFVESYKVRNVKVEGSTHYTTEQIKNMVITDKFSENSVYLSLKYKNKKIENIPFVEHMDVVIEDRNTIKIVVYEKALAGYVTYLENRMYFDKDGIVVEISKESVPGIPEISGLDFDHVVLHEPLPVEDPKVFKDILSMTQLLNKYSLVADRIFFDRAGEITLHFDGVRVTLGTSDYLDEKVMRLAAILPKLRGMKGRLHMETYSDAHKNTTFDIDSN